MGNIPHMSSTFFDASLSSYTNFFIVLEKTLIERMVWNKFQLR